MSWPYQYHCGIWRKRERGINLFELKDRIWAMPGPKNIMILIFVTLFDRKDWIWAMLGPKNVVTWVNIT
eukprot:782791-Ditylum_brightwellii.AAC.1